MTLTRTRALVYLAVLVLLTVALAYLWHLEYVAIMLNPSAYPSPAALESISAGLVLALAFGFAIPFRKQLVFFERGSWRVTLLAVSGLAAMLVIVLFRLVAWSMIPSSLLALSVFWIVAPNLAIVGPGEELLVRGLVMGLAFASISRITVGRRFVVYLLVSAFFAFLHTFYTFDYGLAVPLFAFSLVECLVYDVSGNLLVPIAIHGFGNAVDSLPFASAAAQVWVADFLVPVVPLAIVFVLNFKKYVTMLDANRSTRSWEAGLIE